jgi:lipopolysaccharide/colanic/teichoic acid biosynthesis glycosyltransferase
MVPPQRALDIAVAAVGLWMTSPVLAAAAIAIALSSPGPILYWAPRVGRRGRVFRMCKLRTMHLGADRGSAITAPNDPRVFPVGGVLRATKLDEVPQLWNVLRGDMALVGPRPEDPAIVARHYGALEHGTLAVRPGLTSPGALYGYTHGNALLDPDDPTGSYVSRLMPIKLRLEALYVRDQSVAYDLRILVRTVVIVTQRLLGRRRFPDPREMAHIDCSDEEAGRGAPPPTGCVT